MTQNIVTFDPRELIPLLKKRKQLFGGILLISFCLCLFILLALYLLLPVNSIYAQKVRIMLKKQPQTNLFVYSNGKEFNRQDIISAPVLNQVYQENKLEKFLPFNEFQNLFSVSGFNEDQAKLDAEYAEKLSKRNLDIVNIQRLEEEYRTKRENVPNNIFSITMQNSALPAQLAEKVLSEVPQVWMELYRKLEAQSFPKTMLDSAIAQRLQQEQRTSNLMAITRAYQYSEQMAKLIKQLDDMLLRRNISLPTGETLTVLRDNLDYLTCYQLNTMRQLLMEDASVRSPMDAIFVKSKLQDLQRKQIELQTQIQSLTNSMEILTGSNVTSSQKSSDRNENSQIIIDPSVFTQITDFVASSSNSGLKKEIALQNLDRGQELALINSNILYFQQLLNALNNNNRTVSGSKAQFSKMFESMTTDLATLGIKLNQFRRMLTEEYLSHLEFYIPQNTITRETERAISIQRCAILLFLLCGLFNLIFDGIVLWMDAQPRKENQDS